MTLFWFRYETFYYLFEFKVFRYEERERDNFLLSWLFHLTPPRAAPLKTTGLASAKSKNRLALSKPKSQRTVFFQFPNPQPITSGHDVIHVPGHISYLGFLLWHLWLSHPPCTCVNTCSQCVHLTNPCTKPKGSQPN